MPQAWILQADARRIPLRDGCVQCVVTSPPYWGLRKYQGEQELVWGGDEMCEHQWKAGETVRPLTGGTAHALTYTINQFVVGHNAQSCTMCATWRGAFGLEPTIGMYVEHSIEILREIRRVLRDDGVVFLNLGDSYSRGGRTDHGTCIGEKQGTNRGTADPKFRIPNYELKPKDLCLIPQRIALAAQADGWWVRSDIIWAKPNPMPESVTDRPTDAYEHILMLTKSARYSWDAEAVKEPARDWGTRERKNFRGGTADPLLKHFGFKNANQAATGRNLRNVWTFPTQPYKGAHFATFPEELPRRCIKAATSEKGCCAKCGTPWERVVERKAMEINRTDWGDRVGNRTATSGTMTAPPESKTLGWRPGCECGSEETVPCLVLDPFGCSGTTARVALELGRNAVSLDLAYHDLAKKRLTNVQFEIVCT